MAKSALTVEWCLLHEGGQQRATEGTPFGAEQSVTADRALAHVGSGRLSTDDHHAVQHKHKVAERSSQLYVRSILDRGG